MNVSLNKIITLSGFKTEKVDILKAAERYRLISEGTTDLVFLTTFELNPVFTYVSPSHKVVMGYEKSDLIGKDAFQLIHKDDKPGLIALLTEYLAANIESNSQQKQLDVFETIECRAKDIHGNWHYLQCTVNILGNELLFVSKDITKQKMAELALRDSELRYRTIFENTGTASVIIEEDTTISMVNSEFE